MADQDIYVTRADLPPLEDYVDAIRGMWDTRRLTNMGPLCGKLEEALKNYLGCDKLELYVNGHMALDVAIKALRLTGEVITTPFTFASTAHALVMNGLTPVFCDIRPDDLTLDADKAEALITEKTSAILAVHVYGRPCHVEQLESIARRHRLKLIYDAAHAFGVRLDGRPITDFGDVSMLSFHATKVFNTIEGGALIYHDDALTQSLRNLRNFGIEGEENVVRPGLNAKMNEFAAAMGLCNLKYTDENLRARRRVAQRYDAELRDLPGLETIAIQNDPRVAWNWAYYPVLIDAEKAGLSRDALYEALKAARIFARKYFYPLVTDYACYRGVFQCGALPAARVAAARVLTLPIYAGLQDGDVDRVCGVIRGLLSGAHRAD